MKIDKVVKTIVDYNMIADNKNIVVGLSGGADSVCLLHVLYSLKDKLHLNIFACHLNHMLRGKEAHRDEEFCKKLCKEFSIELEISRINVSNESEIQNKSFELCAREIRYNFFNECAKKHNALIATAHTMSDSMETVMFNIMRGTSLKGICGIPPRRDNIIRPLINITREEVEEYCKENNLNYVTDSTNLSDDYSRNFIRHNIIPLLREKSGNFEKAFSHMTKTLFNDNDYLEKSTNELLKNAKLENGYSCNILADSHIALLSRAVLKILKENKIKEDFKTVSLITDAISLGKGKIRLSKDVYATVKNGIFFFEKEVEKNAFFQVQIENNEAKLPFDNKKVLICDEDKEKLLIFQEFNKKDLKNYLDYAKIKGKLFARQRKEGDEVLLHKRGCTKLLKKLFNESKIPTFERSKKVVICDDVGIVWVEDFGVCERCCVDETTKYICKIKIMT